MLEKLQAVENRYEELCARSEQPDFYADPKKAAAILREQNDLELMGDQRTWLLSMPGEGLAAYVGYTCLYKIVVIQRPGNLLD